jgi:hypothetical protein
MCVGGGAKWMGVVQLGVCAESEKCGECVEAERGKRMGQRPPAKRCKGGKAADQLSCGHACRHTNRGQSAS